MLMNLSVFKCANMLFFPARHVPVPARLPERQLPAGFIRMPHCRSLNPGREMTVGKKWPNVFFFLNRETCDSNKQAAWGPEGGQAALILGDIADHSVKSTQMCTEML